MLTDCSVPMASSSSSCWQAVRQAAAVVRLIDDHSQQYHLSSIRNATRDVKSHIMYMYVYNSFDYFKRLDIKQTYMRDCGQHTYASLS